MIKRMAIALCTAFAVGCVATVAAQSGTMEKKSDKMMDKAMSMTGCVETGSAPGSYMLTHMDMKKMSKDKKSDDKMSNDKMANDKMDMSMDKMMLMGTKVDLSKHMGHKVTVMGTKGADGMMVTSLKMVAATCS